MPLTHNDGESLGSCRSGTVGSAQVDNSWICFASPTVYCLGKRSSAAQSARVPIVSCGHTHGVHRCLPFSVPFRGCSAQGGMSFREQCDNLDFSSIVVLRRQTHCTCYAYKNVTVSQTKFRVSSITNEIQHLTRSLRILYW